jgi:hypothetical protein
MYRQNTGKNSGNNENKQFGNAEILNNTNNAKDYPIIEKETNALLWPEEIKGGIDLSDTSNFTDVPESPYTPLKTQNLSNEKYISPL